MLLAGGCSATTPSAAPDDTPACDDLEWIVGTWVSEDGSNTERWSRGESLVLVGDNVTVKNGEVVHREELRIERTAAGMDYRAAPSGQRPNSFTLTTCGSQWATFTDPEHDWPQSITYRRDGNALTATVEGPQNGRTRTETWTWTAKP